MAIARVSNRDKPLLKPLLNDFQEQSKIPRGAAINLYIIEFMKLLVVPGAGLEPAQPYGRGILSPLRLPISPPGQPKAERHCNALPRIRKSKIE